MTGSAVQANYGHAFTRWWEHCHVAHPDYFALLPNGKRVPAAGPGRVNLCVSNPAVAARWMENARAFFRANPEAISFSASPNDNGYQGHCLCPECEKWDAPEARHADLAKWTDWSNLAARLFYRPNLLHEGHSLPLIFVHQLAANMTYRGALRRRACSAA
jgi:hypothetical protein